MKEEVNNKEEILPDEGIDFGPSAHAMLITFLVEIALILAIIKLVTWIV